MQIQDRLTPKRIEWLFGIAMVVKNNNLPQPSNPAPNNSTDPAVSSQSNQVVVVEDSYDSAGCLEDPVIVYESNLGLDAPQSLCTYLYRIRNLTELYVLSIFRYLLPII